VGNNVFFQVPNGRAGLCLYPILFAFLLLGACGGGSGSSSRPEPGPAIENVLVYQDEIADGRPVNLNVLNREGETRRLSEDTGEVSVQYHAVSPDGTKVVYGYLPVDGEAVLELRGLDPAPTTRTRVVNEGQWPALYSNELFQWLPDSRRVLYSLTNGSVNLRLSTSLWLASIGKDKPTQLMKVDSDGGGFLTYVVSADGRRVAVAVNFLVDQRCCFASTASLYLLDLDRPDELVLIETASGVANNFEFSWSPTGNELLFQRWLHTGNSYSANGPLMLLSEDGRSRILREGDNEYGSRWLDQHRIVVPLQTGFEVIAPDGGLLATHAGTINGAANGAGAVSIVQSPDGRRLAFLDWTSKDELEVYLLDMQTTATRVVGPASSIPIISHDPNPSFRRYRASELHWSADGSWLVWDSPAASQFEGGLYAHAVATEQTRLVSRRAEFWDSWEVDTPWLPAGNVVEYQTPSPDTVTVVPVLVADDLDSGTALFAGTFPMSSFTVTDPESAELLQVHPYNICRRTWLGNGELLWGGCDGNTYLSLITGATLADTRLIARGANLYLASRNREIFVLSPDHADGHWQMYDRAADRVFTLDETVDWIPLAYTTLLL